ncbi:MAG: hypothetical protein ACHQKZ_10715 [Solirubrobacterales bacterium]
MPVLAGPALGLAVASLAMAHPHLKKTITVALPAGASVTISYTTEPSNESHTAKAAAGSFLHAGARLTLSTEVKAGAVTLPAGEYTIGAIKNADNDYTMALYPGPLRLSDTPDKAKMIKLESAFSNDMGTAHHMLVDVSPGHGTLEGKTVLTLHFGSLFLAGALS